MAFWRGERLAKRPDVIDDFNPDQIDCNAYNLRMGGTYYRTGEHEEGHEQKKMSLAERQAFLIPPGQFAFLLSKETVRIPTNAMAFISMRTGIKFQGLINVSGFHVDPGYEGKLIYAVYNASPSPIQICEDDKIFKIWFCDLDDMSDPTYTFKGKGLSDISSDMIKGMNRDIYSLQSLADQIREQKFAIEQRFSEQKPVIENLALIWRTAVMGVIGAVIIAVLTLTLTFSIPIVYKAGKFLSKTMPEAAASSSAAPAAATPPASVPASKSK